MKQMDFITSKISASNVWREGMKQRVCWLNGKHIMTGGNSFAAPHITGIIAHLLEQHPKCSVEDIRLLLQEKALREIISRSE